jgi:hypothetical protein
MLLGQLPNPLPHIALALGAGRDRVKYVALAERFRNVVIIPSSPTPHPSIAATVPALRM